MTSLFSHICCDVPIEDLELVDLDARGPGRGSLEDVLRVEGRHTLVRRLQALRARNGLQGRRGERLVHVVLCFGFPLNGTRMVYFFKKLDLTAGELPHSLLYLLTFLAGHLADGVLQVANTAKKPNIQHTFVHETVCESHDGGKHRSSTPVRPPYCFQMRHRLEHVEGGGPHDTRFHLSAVGLTVELEVVVHDEAAGEAESHVVVVLEGHQQRVVQVLKEKHTQNTQQ